MRRLLTRRKLALGAGALIALVALFALIGALRGGTSSRSAQSHTRATASAQGTAQAGPAMLAPAGGQTSGSGAQAGADTSASTLAYLQAHYLVRSGSLSIEVAKGQVAAAAGRVSAITQGLAGYVVSEQYFSSGSSPTPLPEPATAGAPLIVLPPGGPYAQVTVRVPVDSFETAAAEFGRLGKVDTISTQTEDVTAQYVDLSARLAHYRAVQQRLLTFLARTTSVGQALAVQQRIDATELTVEQLTGELKALRQTVVYGTITVTISERPLTTVAHGTTGSFPSAFLRSLRLIWSGARATFVALGAALPFVVLIALLWLAASRFIARRRRGGQQSAAGVER
jgi:hypothetical protein